MNIDNDNQKSGKRVIKNNKTQYQLSFNRRKLRLIIRQ